MEEQNTLIFIVDRRANKKQIKEAIEKLYNVKVDEVRTLIHKGYKKAYIKLKPEYNAEDIGIDLGVL